MRGTHRRTWQKAEGRAAALFGAQRQPGSGSSGRLDLTCSDSNHPRLYVETKLRGRHTARTLHDDVRGKAKREGKLPILCLADKHRPGFLVCVHSDDLAALVAELATAMSAGAADGPPVACVQFTGGDAAPERCHP